MKILTVDTALGACSVAVLEGERLLARRFERMDRGHAEALAPMVEEVVAEAGIGFAVLDRLAVTVGPGTFTGQRVGLAFMRGLRIALKKPLTGVTTLAAMAAQASAESGLATAAALHDAKRDEVYFELRGGGDSVGPMLLSFEEAVRRLMRLEQPFALAGTAAEAAQAQLANAVLSSVRQPDALWVARLAQAMPEPESPPRPLYLRAPDAKLPAAR